LQHLQFRHIFGPAPKASFSDAAPGGEILDRRRFLQLSALGILTALADSACGVLGDRDAALNRPELLTMLGPDRVRQLGAHYRASTPDENTDAALRTALSGANGQSKPSLTTEALDKQIRNDFAADRTVVVDGWVLSLTEARQAALFSLSPG
jgi:hypothetical protein